MKGFYPAGSNSVLYLYLESKDDDFIYLLPDGRVSQASQSYFADLSEHESTEFTPEQLENYKLSHLNTSFIKFIILLKEKIEVDFSKVGNELADDSDVGNKAIKFSNAFETMDGVKYDNFNPPRYVAADSA